MRGKSRIGAKTAARFIDFIKGLWKRMGQEKWLYLLMLVALITRAYNLNYNSAYNDEAIYIVLGKLGIFHWDWWSFNPSNWVAGSIYGYPVLSALSYEVGGLGGSRLLNVLISVGLIELVYKLARNLVADKRLGHRAGIIAGLILVISATNYKVARLATYDMVSIYLMFLSIYFLTLTEKWSLPGKWYFLSGLTLWLSVFFKVITGLFVPLILYAGYKIAKKHGAGRVKLFIWYMVMPLVVGGTVYALMHGQGIWTYLTSQVNREPMAISIVGEMILDQLNWLMPLGAISLMLLDRKNPWGLWLLAGAGVIPVFHIIFTRSATLDKHVALSVVFLAIIIGLGLSRAWERLGGSKLANTGYRVVVIGMLAIFGWHSVEGMVKANEAWDDTRKMEAHIKKEVTGSDLILAQHGPQVMLALYENQNPLNVSTFDWFEYQGSQGVDSYINALKDGYFKLVEIASYAPYEQEYMHHEIYEVIEENLGVYTLAYQDEQTKIYKRNY